MRATIESTTELLEMKDIQGRPFACRVWEGVSAGGVRFTAYIPVVQVLKTDENYEFVRELREHVPPDDITRRAIDLRLVI